LRDSFAQDDNQLKELKNQSSIFVKASNDGTAKQVSYFHKIAFNLFNFLFVYMSDVAKTRCVHKIKQQFNENAFTVLGAHHE